tara:strand:- start:3324 stop:3683 length:360 start_codon:yes stop_codon:yes gene_type:complete
MDKTFKTKHTVEERRSEFQRIHEKYPERIPIIVENIENSANENIPVLEKKKFLVPPSITFGQFMYIIRSRINLAPEKAIFVFINNVIPCNTQNIQQIYNEYKDEDGFLYCTFSGESTFG